MQVEILTKIAEHGLSGLIIAALAVWGLRLQEALATVQAQRVADAQAYAKTLAETVSAIQATVRQQEALFQAMQDAPPPRRR